MTKEKRKWKHSHEFDVAAYVAERNKREPGYEAAFEEAMERHDIARRLAKLRAVSGLSQLQLAKKLHTSQAAISRLESADYEGHTISTLKKYLHAVGATMTITFHRAPVERPVRFSAARKHVLAKHGNTLKKLAG